MNVSHFIKYCLGLLAFACLYACQTNTVYYTYEPISTEGWSKTDTLEFYLPDSVNLGTYHLEVGVRHSGKYPYRDLWLEITQYIPDLQAANEWTQKKDTIHIYLANEKGIWNGTGTTSGHFQLLSNAGELSIEGNKLPDGEIKQDTDKEVHGQTSKRKKYTFEGKPHSLGKMANHRLKVTHIMTDSLLMHITDVGLRLSKE